jgi:hypothetical protein
VLAVVVLAEKRKNKEEKKRKMLSFLVGNISASSI